MDVERALLSAAIGSGAISAVVSRGILPEHFIGEQTQRVYEWCSDYSRRYGASPALHIVQHRHPDWQGEWSAATLDFLCDEFLCEVRRRAFESKVLELAEIPERVGRDRYWAMRERLDEILLDAARELAAIVPTGTVGRFAQDLEMRIESYEDEKGRHRPGIPLGIPIIDPTMGGGAKAGWVITMAGFSGIGKSGLASHALLNAFEDDKVALMLSAEMSSHEVLERLDTMVMRWKHRDLTQHQLTSAQVQSWRDVGRIYRKAAGEIVVLDKIGGCSLDRVHAEIERYKPAVACIDYVQRLKTSSKRPKWEQLEEITNDLKTIAMDTDTAIIMVSQDGRDSAEQGSTRTNMGGSIAVYQAADIYIGMLQDEAMRAMNKMRVKLLKNRHGPCAEVDVVWSPESWDLCRLWRDSDQFVKPNLQAVA